MSVANAIVALAVKELGVREEGGNNRGARVRVYQGATWLKPDAWPWCAAFCAWVLMEALKSADGQAYLQKKAVPASAFRCKDASAFGWLDWAKKQRLVVFDESDPKLTPQAGDFVVFDFSHIGVVERPVLSGGRVVAVNTVEGNTNGKGERDSESGDGVWRKTRAVGLVRGYIRL